MTARSLTLAAFPQAHAPPSLRALTGAFDVDRPVEGQCADPFEEGFAAGRAATGREVSAAVDALDAACADIRREQQGLEAQFRDDASLWLSKIINASAPKIALAASLTALRSLIDGAASPAPLDTIEIRAHPDFLGELRAAFEQAKAPCACAFVEDDALPHGVLRANWPGGGLRCDAETAIAAISEYLDRTIASTLFEGLES